MSKLSLPVLSGSIRLEEAVEVMKQSGRGAVIGKEGDCYLLFFAENVVKGLRTNKDLLSDIKEHSTILKGLTPSAISKIEIESKPYAYANVDLESTLAKEVRFLPTIYHCTSMRHLFLPNEVPEDETCPLDGSKIVSS